ncbi:TSC22 domain family protein 3 isoform X2 [Anabrus simplex]|uniref:TSC22 domain family protein 3 isoform X2 n=1 Tax=Anabrus simplex TaxID=316456 RepID=UPI0034DD7867
MVGPENTDCGCPLVPLDSQALSTTSSGRLYSRRQLRANLHRNMARMLSASGTSAVAIDNKIEQAMDLVKSHLMFAVREEVEVLKEKIAELMDRINQLELENTILKAHASQETLAQLSGNNPQQQGNKNQQTQPPSNGSVS